MVKGPVRFDERRGLIYDSDDIFMLDVLCDDTTALEVVKWVNLHVDLTKALEHCLAFFEDRASTKGDSEKVKEFNELLEKCK